MSPFRARRVRRSLATLCLILAGRLTPNFAGAKPAGRLSPARVPHPGTSRNGAKTRLRPAGTVFPVGASHCVLRPPLACKGANLIVSSRASYRLACSQPVCQAARHSTSNPRRLRCPTTRLGHGSCAYLPGIPRSGDVWIAHFRGGSKVLCRPPTSQSLRGTSLVQQLSFKSCSTRRAFPLTAPPNPVAGMLLAERNWICWRKSTYLLDERQQVSDSKQVQGARYKGLRLAP